MASESVTHAAHRELFSFNGAYLIHPGTDADDLLNDASCWLESAKEIVNEMASGLTDEGSQTQANPSSAGRMLWGAYHLLLMAEGAVDQAHKASLKGEKA